MPAAEAWDLYGGRCDEEPHLAKLCSSVLHFLSVCRVEGGWGREGATMRGKDSERENVKENVRELRGILTHYGCVEG